MQLTRSTLVLLSLPLLALTQDNPNPLDAAANAAGNAAASVVNLPPDLASIASSAGVDVTSVFNQATATGANGVSSLASLASSVGTNAGSFASSLSMQATSAAGQATSATQTGTTTSATGTGTQGSSPSPSASAGDNGSAAAGLVVPGAMAILAAAGGVAAMLA
ncbi:MAG: hypothetical protein LQ346_006584 [Caloplaca aetnensis]|nr:MAG: hypothetical protein LQ346_006584 [Caloplaca aetnensis]